MPRNINPVVVESEEEIEVNYWDKHGERLYCNGLHFDPYVDLETGEMESKKYNATVEDDRVEIVTAGYLNDAEGETVAVISLSGEVDQTEAADEIENAEAPESDTDKDDSGAEVATTELPNHELAEANVGESGQCLHADCDDHADVAVKCDTGEIKHYCDDHHNGRRAGHALIVEEKRLTEPSDRDSTDGDNNSSEATGAEPMPEHVADVGYHAAAGQAQQIAAQRLFADAEDNQ